MQTHFLKFTLIFDHIPTQQTIILKNSTIVTIFTRKLLIIIILKEL
jgi:hypothetical protein